MPARPTLVTATGRTAGTIRGKEPSTTWPTQTSMSLLPWKLETASNHPSPGSPYKVLGNGLYYVLAPGQLLSPEPQMPQGWDTRDFGQRNLSLTGILTRDYIPKIHGHVEKRLEGAGGICRPVLMPDKNSSVTSKCLPQHFPRCIRR